MNRFVNNIGISASHNIALTQNEVDLQEAISIKKYLENNLMSTVKFKRSLEGFKRGFDENKFLFPLYTEGGVLPLVSIPIISALHTDPKQVSVLGSYDVGKVVNDVKNYLIKTNRKELSDKLFFVSEMPEGYTYDKNGIKQLSLFNSISRLKNSFKDKAQFVFSTGDIIAYSFLDAMTDSDILENELVLDLNAKERINPRVQRNYYSKGRRIDGTKVSFKEPNMFIFGDKFPFESVELFYQNREKGGLSKALRQMVWDYKRNLIHLTAIKGFTNIGIEYTSSLIEKREFIFDERDAQDAAKVLSTIRIKAEHTDPLRLIDVDGLEDLLILQNCVSCFDKIFPSKIYDDLMNFSKYFKEEGNRDFPIIDNFKDEMNTKIKRIQSKLPSEISSKLQTPYDEKGKLIMSLRENLDSFIQRLIEERESYEDRHKLKRVA